MFGEYFIVFAVIVISALFSYFFIKFFINITKKAGRMLVPDMNKFHKPMIPKTGGIAVIISITLGLSVYLFFKIFIIGTFTNLNEIFLIMITFLLAGFIGMIDDIFGWRKSLTGWQKILMTIPIAIPLMVTNIGSSTIILPIIGKIGAGLFYPLLLVPIGLIGATNGFNLLAGYNGLEAGLATIIFSLLGLVAFISGEIFLSMVALIIVSVLLIFFLFNKFSAKIFPGNSFTYAIGALIACFAIIGNMEKIALILFLPFIFEGILKARGNFRAESLAKPNEDNNLEMPYNRIYSLTHISILFLKKIKKKAYEIDVTRLLLILEIIIAALIIVTYL